MSKGLQYEKLDPYVFVTKLAGFEHTKHIQGVATHQPESDTDVPMVQGKNIRNGFFVQEHEWFISKDVSDALPRSVLDKPCILIPYVGSNLGEVGIFPNGYRCHLASNIAKVELISEKYILEYLKYYLQSDIGQGYLFQSKQGSAQPNITMESIRNTLIIERSQPEQQKICDVLSTVDQKFLLNQKICTELETMAKTLYDYWFTQFDFPNEEGKPYRSSGGAMEWNDQLKREIPKGWDIGNLYAIADPINGLACQKHRPKENEKALPVVKIKEMHEGITEETELVSVNIPEKHKIFDGDILFSWSATLEVMYWFGGNAGLNQHIFKVLPINGFAKEYVYHQFSAYVINFVKMAEARKTTMGHITTDHLEQSRIVLPPAKIVQAFSEIVAPIHEKIGQCQKENRELIKLRDWLLPMLMNGQATVE